MSVTLLKRMNLNQIIEYDTLACIIINTQNFTLILKSVKYIKHE